MARTCPSCNRAMAESGAPCWCGGISCGRCGGALTSHSEICRCGGRSPLYSTRRAEPAPDAPGWYEAHESELADAAGKRRTLTWQEAFAELRRRYVPPA